MRSIAMSLPLRGYVVSIVRAEASVAKRLVRSKILNELHSQGDYMWESLPIFTENNAVQIQDKIP